MGSSPTDLLAGCGLTVEATVPWGERVPIDDPGVYVVSVHRDPSCGDGPGPVSLSDECIDTLVDGAPDPTVSGRPATAAELRSQIARSWFAEEPVVYIVLASKSVRRRIDQFVATPIGAPRPHAGGWFLKMLDSSRHPLWVHGARSAHCAKDETALLDAFIERLSPASRAQVVDPALPIPFANLERAKGERKRHGVRGVIRRRSPA